MTPKTALVHDWLNQIGGAEDVLDTLPPAYDRPLYAQKCSALFDHVYESYPERGSGVYAAVS